MTVEETEEYQLIKAAYGTQTAKRSGVLLINHIDEGLGILKHIGAPESAMRAYCLHPLFQSDTDLAKNSDLTKTLDPYIVMLALEYRNIANAYLSHREIKTLDDIALSPLPEVNQMLVADKIQNFKDFMIYHHESHQRSDALHRYFKNWFDRLGIPSAVFSALEKKSSSLQSCLPLLKKPSAPQKPSL